MLDRAASILESPQPEYHPWSTGTFDARAGLFKLGQQKVAGESGQRIFLLDESVERAIANKRAIHRDRQLHRHYVAAALDPSVRRAFIEFVATQLVAEWPRVFGWKRETSIFSNRLLGWSARLDSVSGSVDVFERRDGSLAHLADVEPVDAIDFLACNVAEDLAVWQRDPESGNEWLSLLHVSAPHHWDPREKIGHDFERVHAPVADIEPTSAAASRLARAAVEQGPFVRFAWGVATNDRLNHHPDAPHDGDRDNCAQPAIERLFLRVERQTLFGWPRANACLFTIRPYWYRVADVASEPLRRRQLTQALKSMSDRALAYKGLVTLRDPLVRWLETG